MTAGTFSAFFCSFWGIFVIVTCQSLHANPSFTVLGLETDSRDVMLFQVEQSKVLVKEGGVQLTLTIVDTPGFGDAVDNSNW